METADQIYIEQLESGVESERNRANGWRRAAIAISAIFGAIIILLLAFSGDLTDQKAALEEEVSNLQNDLSEKDKLVNILVDEIPDPGQAIVDTESIYQNLERSSSSAPNQPILLIDVVGYVDRYEYLLLPVGWERVSLGRYQYNQVMGLDNISVFDTEDLQKVLLQGVKPGDVIEILPDYDGEAVAYKVCSSDIRIECEDKRIAIMEIPGAKGR